MHALAWMILGAAMGGEPAPRPAGHPGQSRSVVMALNGMVATSHPLAAQAGVEILQKGGNAIDAAIAANATLGVVEPMSCGIGGDLFAIVWDAKTKRLYGLNASGRSPYAATIAEFRKRGLTQIPETGPLSWSVPGCVDGWAELNKRFGKLSLAEILDPAIRHAENGYPVVELIGTFWQMSLPLLKQTPDAAETFLFNGRAAPRIGQVLENPYLAKTYRKISENPQDFYRGSIAHRIVAFSQEQGGLFSLKDFEDHASTWIDPVSTSYREHDVWALPPNGQGIAVLQMLNILEEYDIKGLGHNSPEFLHAFIEAKKLVYEDRARFYADMDFYKDLPLKELISKEYASARRKLIDPNKASTACRAGDPKLVAGDTVYLTVVDKDRNAVSLIQSIYYGWGSGLAPKELGFMLQNRGNLFALDESHPNKLEPHKRPFHTIIPAMVTENGEPWFCFGVMGGDMQPQGQVQVLINIIDHEMNVQLAGEMARCRHEGSSTPTGDVMVDGGLVRVERGISEETVDALKAKGHRVAYGNSSEFGGYQGILIDRSELAPSPPTEGILHGASEHRKDGAAIGY